MIEGKEEERLRELMRLPNIGLLRARALYNAGFRTLDDIATASEEDLAKVPGIRMSTGKRLKKILGFVKLPKSLRRELVIDIVEREVACPACETILNTFESECYECGNIMNSHGKNVQDKEKALLIYTWKLKMNADDPKTWYGRGILLEEIGRYEEADQSFDRVVKIDPEYEGVWHAKARVWNKMGRPSKAARMLRHTAVHAAGGARNPNNDFSISNVMVPKAPNNDLEIFLLNLIGEISNENFSDDTMSETSLRDEFTRGEEEWTCSNCDGIVTADSTTCPSCGVVFMDE